MPWRAAIFTTSTPLYLASSSPRRIAFFRELGLHARTIVPPEAAEPAPLPGENPAVYAVRAAAAKALGVLTLVPDFPAGMSENSGCPADAPLIIAADTIVVLDNRILGKPKDAGHAFAMLSSLTGRTHTVISGCALLRALPLESGGERCLAPAAQGDLPTPQTPFFCFAVETRVHMWNCPEPLLRAYAMSGEPLDKAGAYAVQGAGAFLVERLEGSWSNVVGLPVAELVRALLHMGVLAEG